MVTRKSIPHYTALLIWLIVGTAFCGSLQPTRTADDLDNPHKGFVLWGTDYIDGPPKNRFGSTIFHIYAPWRELEIQDQDFAWEAFERQHLLPILKDYPLATFVIRPVVDYPDGDNSGITLAYNGGERHRDYPKWLEHTPHAIGFNDYKSCDGNGPGRVPDWNNPAMIKQLVELIEAFGARYDGDDRITAIQAGLLGLWGEWHQSGCDKWGPGDAVKVAVRDAYARSFKRTPLQIRYPRIPDAVGVEFGFYEDFFPSFTAPCDYGFPKCDHTGDWNLDWAIKHRTPESADNWKSNPISGESPMGIQKKCWVNQTDSIIKVLQDYHFSFLGPAGQHEKPGNEKALHRIKRTLGYNLHITQIDWPDQVKKTTDGFKISVAIMNSGAAPVYHPVELDIHLSDAAGNGRTFQLPIVGKNLRPGILNDCINKLHVDELDAGKYTLSIGMVNANRRIHIQSSGRDAKGRINVGTIQITN